MAINLFDRFANHPYRTDKVLLLPYLDSQQVFPEDFLVRLYRQTRDEGLIETVFAGTPNFNLNRFISFMSARPIVLYIQHPNDVAGYGFISQSEGVDGARKAAFGFLFFKKYRGTVHVRDLCTLSLAWWFYELNTDILYATSLKTNRLAWNFAKKVFGFTFLCDLPMFFCDGGRLADAVLMCLKREDFTPQYNRWKQMQAFKQVPSNEATLVVT